MDEVPELRSVRNLTLNSNRLSEPIDLTMFEELEALTFQNCQLTQLPRLANPQRLINLHLIADGRGGDGALTDLSGLSEMRSLRSLTLMGTGLRLPPDLSEMRGLQSLLLADGLFEVMPDVRGLSRLHWLSMSGNNLATLPRWLAALPDTMEVYLSGNPLDQGTVDWLTDLRTGPQVHFSMAVSTDDGAPASMREQVDAWASDKTERWTAFAGEAEAGQFARLLRALKRTADYQNSDESRRDLQRRVVAVLDALEQAPELRALCFASAEEGLGTCGDRVALTFSDIEMRTQACRLGDDQVALMKLARSLSRLGWLAALASRASWVAGAGETGTRDLAHAVPQLLGTLARAQEAQGGEDVKRPMCARLLGRHQGELAALPDRIGKYDDFYSRALLLNPGSMESRLCALGLRREGMMPRQSQAEQALGTARVDKLGAVLKKAVNRAKEEWPEPPKKAPTLEEAAHAVSQLASTLETARAGDEQSRVRQVEAKRREDMDYHFHEAVSSVLNGAWAKGVAALKRELKPSGAHILLQPVDASLWAKGANGLPERAPSEQLRMLEDALRASQPGQEVMQGLSQSRQPYRQGDHPTFDALVGKLAGKQVEKVMKGLGQDVTEMVAAEIAEFAERDALVEQELKWKRELAEEGGHRAAGSDEPTAERAPVFDGEAFMADLEKGRVAREERAATRAAREPGGAAQAAAASGSQAHASRTESGRDRATVSMTLSDREIRARMAKAPKVPKGEPSALSTREVRNLMKAAPKVPSNPPVTTADQLQRRLDRLRAGDGPRPSSTSHRVAVQSEEGKAKASAS